MQPGGEKWALDGDTRGERRAAALPFSYVSEEWGEGYSAESFFSTWAPLTGEGVAEDCFS